MDLRGYRMVTAVNMHPEYLGLGDYFGTGKERPSERRTPEEWVSIAEEMAGKNGGALQSARWIQVNGPSGLRGAMERRPELFAHIKQEKARRTLKEWVPVAEALAGENGGKLPSHEWLVNHKFGGLAQCMRKFPNSFVHIEQEKPQGHYKSPQGWITEVEDLAEKHGGILPSSKRLQKSGCHGIDQAIRKKPGLFAHIPQEVLGPGGRIVGIRINGQIQKGVTGVPIHNSSERRS